MRVHSSFQVEELAGVSLLCLANEESRHDGEMEERGLSIGERVNFRPRMLIK